MANFFRSSGVSGNLLSRVYTVDDDGGTIGSNVGVAILDSTDGDFTISLPAPRRGKTLIITWVGENNQATITSDSLWDGTLNVSYQSWATYMLVGNNNSWSMVATWVD